MKKKYLVKFSYQDGKEEEVELTTDNIKWSIEQYRRNRPIVSHKIVNEGSNNSKQILFG
ncbi:hypothetical protein N9J42_00345 [bacterium]|jgi:hypothetical protein|nr:hypothetical protein [bacterium]